MKTPEPIKQLGQHWLKDPAVLSSIVEFAELTDDDTVLEIGPGLGDLTRKLCEQAGSVVAVEIDSQLARQLPQLKNLTVVTGDIKTFDLNSLPKNYKVVANLPYYLTSHILQLLSRSSNPPKSMTLLVQKEVAERLAAKAGQHSILSLSMQIYGQAELGELVPAQLFQPPPKVDSQVIKLTAHDKPPIDSSEEIVMKLIKTGFSSKRKTLLNNLLAGLRIEKSAVKQLLDSAGVVPRQRAQELSLKQWDKLAKVIG